MSLIGNATAKRLRGKINKIDVIYTDTYEIAVKNGYEGTVTEWLETLGGGASRLSSVTLLASEWTDIDDGLFAQVVNIEGTTEYSKVDLLPDVYQLAIFHNKDVTFVTENEDGVVTVYAIGEKPLLDYTMQVQITEVVV